MRILSQISDDELAYEYKKRFTLKTGDIVKCSSDAVKHFEGLIGGKQDREYFAVMYLNGKNKVILAEILFTGTLTTSAVYPREILKRILDVNAASIIVAHNHPSGNLNPSKDDIKITEKIKTSCNSIDVVLHDHLIITQAGEFTSLKDKGVL